MEHRGTFLSTAGPRISFSQHHFVIITLIGGEKLILPRDRCLCGDCTFSPFLHRFSPSTPAPSHIPEIHVRWTGVSEVSQSWVSVGVCEWPHDGRVFCPGWAPVWTRSGHPQPWTGISRLENNSYLFLLITLKCTFISVLNIRCVLGLYLEIGWVLWPEICCRNVTLVYIN